MELFKARGISLVAENGELRLIVQIPASTLPPGGHVVSTQLDDSNVAELGGVLLGYSMGRDARGAELLADMAKAGTPRAGGAA